MQKNPFDQFDTQVPGGPQIIIPVAQSVQDKDAAELANARLSGQRTAQQIQQDRLTTPAQVRKLNIETQAAALALEKQRRDLAAGPSTKLSPEERSKAISGYKSSQQLDQVIADIQARFADGPGATSGLSGLLDLNPFSTANQRFDAAGNRARGFAKQALGFTGGENNTPAESLQNLGGYIPQASDRDAVALDKINALKQLRDTARERSIATLGGVPDATGNIVAMGAAGVSDPPAIPPGPSSAPPAAGGVAGGYIGPGGSGGDGEYSNALGVAMAKKLAKAHSAGASLDDLNSMLVENGYQPFTDPEAIKAINKGGKINFAPPRAADNRSGFSKAIGGLGGGALGAYALSAGDTLTGGFLDEIAGGQTQLAKEYAAKEFPLATMAGGVTGAAAAMYPVGLGAQALGKGSALGGFLIGNGARAAATGDAAYGALLGAGQSNDDRLSGAAIGGLTGILGNAVGTGITKAAGKALRGVGDSAVRLLTERGVPLTFGQTLGNRGMIGKFANTMESVPGIGSMLNARRSEGVQAFDREAIKDVLEPIGATIQGEAGQAAVGQAQDAVSDAYTKALSGLNIRADQPFMTQLAAAVNGGRAVPVAGEQFGHLMDTKFAPLFGPGVTLDGPGFQSAMQAVRGAKAQFGGEGAMGGLVADHLDTIDDALADLIARQAPQNASDFAAANQAYRALSPINDASAAAVNSGVEAGVFTPAQLNRAVTNNTKNYGGKAAAARGANQTDLMRAGQEVLPATIGNSGSADRLLAAALPAALGGGAYSLSDVSPTTAGILAALAAASTKTGGNLLQSALVKRPDVARRAGQYLVDNARIGGAIGGPLALGAAR